MSVIHLHPSPSAEARDLLAEIDANVRTAETLVRELCEARSRLMEENARTVHGSRIAIDQSRELLKQTEALLRK